MLVKHFGKWKTEKIELSSTKGQIKSMEKVMTDQICWGAHPWNCHLIKYFIFQEKRKKIRLSWTFNLIRKDLCLFMQWNVFIVFKKCRKGTKAKLQLTTWYGFTSKQWSAVYGHVFRNPSAFITPFLKTLFFCHSSAFPNFFNLETDRDEMTVFPCFFSSLRYNTGIPAIRFQYQMLSAQSLQGSQLYLNSYR